MIEIAVRYSSKEEKNYIIDLYKLDSHSYHFYNNIIIFNFIDSKKRIVEEIKNNYKIEYLYQRDNNTKDDIFVTRGDLLYVNFPYKKWNEYGGKQYAVVIQHNRWNYTSTTTIIAVVKPFDITTMKYKSSINSIIYINGKVYIAILNSIRTIDKMRIIEKIGRITKEEQEEIDNKLINIIF